jgi:membrane-associated two-gene conflict system component 1 (EACC1)
VAALRVDLDLGPGADSEEVDEAARALLRELRELDVESVERVSEGPAPEGSRALEVAAVGSLVVTLGKSALGAFAGVLQAWLARRSGRTVKLTLGSDSIEITGGSASYQRQLIETFLAARAGD